MGFQVARGIVQHQKNFKRQSLIGKVLPDFRDNVLMEPIQKKGSQYTGLLAQPQDWQAGVYLCPPRLAALQVKTVLIVNPTAFAPNSS